MGMSGFRSLAASHNNGKLPSLRDDGGDSTSLAEPAVAEPPEPLRRGLPVSAGLTVLAVQLPPKPDGRSGAVVFAPGLTVAERLAVVDDMAWFDRRDRARAAPPRRARRVSGAIAGVS